MPWKEHGPRLGMAENTKNNTRSIRWHAKVFSFLIDSLVLSKKASVPTLILPR